MAREDMGDRTEAPTPRRRQEARERGQVPKSTDLTAAVAMLAAMVLLNWTAPGMVRTLAGLMTTLFSYDGSDATSTDGLLTWLVLAGRAFASVFLPIGAGLMLVTILSLVGQVGLMLTFHPLMPSLSKLNPLNGFGRIFSMDGVMRLFTSLFKVGVIGAVAFITVRNRIGLLANIAEMEFWALACGVGEMILMLGIRLAIVLLILAIIDYCYQRYRHEKNLKMTKQEIKEEMRRMEGDPLVAERRRRVARQLAMQRMQAAVPKADVVVTNPTHYAVAIQYDAKTMTAPKVVAKGADYVAQRIREIAIAHDVPIVQRKPLAQALYRTVEIGQEIPPSLYKAVAEILAYVYELNGEAQTRRAALSPNMAR